MTLGEKIASNRKKQGLSQEDLGDKVGVSRQGVSKWETDASVPDIDKLVKLSNIFGITIDEMVKDDFSQEIENSKTYNAEINNIETVKKEGSSKEVTSKTALICVLAITAACIGLVICMLQGFTSGGMVFLVNSILILFIPKDISKMKYRGDKVFGENPNPAWLAYKRRNWHVLIAIATCIGIVSCVTVFLAIFFNVHLFDMWYMLYGTDTERIIFLSMNTSFLFSASFLLALIIGDKVYKNIEKDVSEANKNVMK